MNTKRWPGGQIGRDKKLGIKGWEGLDSPVRRFLSFLPLYTHHKWERVIRIIIIIIRTRNEADKNDERGKLN